MKNFILRALFVCATIIGITSCGSPIEINEPEIKGDTLLLQDETIDFYDTANVARHHKDYWTDEDLSKCVKLVSK